eukprot:scaffold4090_cov114-Isochrysis_galbana.AAC.4
MAEPCGTAMVAVSRSRSVRGSRVHSASSEKPGHSSAGGQRQSISITTSMPPVSATWAARPSKSPGSAAAESDASSSMRCIMVHAWVPMRSRTSPPTLPSETGAREAISSGTKPCTKTASAEAASASAMAASACSARPLATPADTPPPPAQTSCASTSTAPSNRR